jgi:hypothetical protein
MAGYGFAVGGEGLKYLSYQQITVLTSSTALTVPAGAKYALIQAEAQNVRMRSNAVGDSAPTATVGMLIAAGDSIFLSGNLTILRFIETAASAKLNVAYFA